MKNIIILVLFILGVGLMNISIVCAETTIIEKNDINNQKYQDLIILYEGSTNVLKNGEMIKLDPDKEYLVPFESKGKKYVPLRFLVKEFGGELSWNEKSATVSLRYKNNKIELKPNSREMLFNNQIEEINEMVYEKYGRTFVPAVEFAERIFDVKASEINDLIILSEHTVTFNYDEANEIICLFYGKNDNLGIFNTNEGVMINRKGEQVPNVDGVGFYEFHDGLSHGYCKDGDKTIYGFVNKEFKMIFIYDYYRVNDFSEGMAAFTPELMGKWGYIDKTGKVIVAPVYDYADDFSEGLACVGKNGTRIYIDKDGKEVINMNSDFVEEFNPKTGISRDRKWQDFSEGLVPINIGSKEKPKVGYMDKSGNIVIDPIFDTVSPFSEGMAKVGMLNNNNEMKYGFINSIGNIIIELQYDSADDFSEGLARVHKDGNTFFIDKSGEVIIQCNNVFDSFSEGLAMYSDNISFGYINKYGDKVIKLNLGDYKFSWRDRPQNFNNGLAFIESQNLIGYINREGNFVWKKEFTKEEMKLRNLD